MLYGTTINLIDKSSWIDLTIVVFFSTMYGRASESVTKTSCPRPYHTFVEFPNRASTYDSSKANHYFHLFTLDQTHYTALRMDGDGVHACTIMYLFFHHFECVKKFA